MAEHSRTTSLRLRPSEYRIILLIGDLLAGILAVVGSIYFWRQYTLHQLLSTGISLEKAMRFFTIEIPPWFYLLPVAWALLLIDIYDPHSAANWRKTLRGITIAAVIGFIAYAVVFITNKDPNFLPRIGVAAFLVIAFILTMIWRLSFIRLYTSPGLMRRIMIVGAGRSGLTLVQVYKQLKPPPFHLVGFVDDDPDKIGTKIEGVPVFGNSNQLFDLIDEHGVTDLVVAITGEMRGVLFQSLLDAQERGIDVMRMPIIYEEIVNRVPVHHLESDWVIRSFVDQLRVSGFYEMGKRLLDIIGGLVGMLLLVVVFPFAALATLIDSGWPIFYSQTRLGKGARVFKIYKFRSMWQDAEADGKARLAEENDPRVTRVGNFLRQARLDELPQFWNVLHGEMSLVGPRAERPELVQSFQRQIPFYRARLLVKPGLTGWAQVNYGYTSTVQDTGVKLEYDLYYIKHRNLGMDISILVRTVGTVLSRRGR